MKARIERLEEIRSQPGTDPDIRAGLQKQIIDLSVKNRVLSPYTALLVLETEADYERFQINRNALSDILTVGLSGVEVLHRTAASVPVAAPPPPAKAAPTPSLKKAKARPPAEMAFPEGGPEQERAPEVDALRSLSPMQDEAPEPAAEEEESTLVPQRLESRAPDISDEGDTGTRTGTLGRSSPERFEADGLVHSPGLAMDMLEEGSLSSDEADMPLARAAAPSPMRDERPAPMPAPAAARPAAFSPSPKGRVAVAAPEARQRRHRCRVEPPGARVARRAARSAARSAASSTSAPATGVPRHAACPGAAVRAGVVDGHLP